MGTKISYKGNQVGSGNSSGAETIVDKTSLPSSGIENVIYRVTDSVSGETSYHAGNETEAETEQLAKYSDVQIIQTETIPSAGASHVGKIYQYIGATNLSYTNGYFYKCVSDGESTPSYSWEEVQVQEGSEGKVNATALEDSTAIAAAEDGIYYNVDDGKIYQVVSGAATEVSKVIDTCLITYGLYEDNKANLDELDIKWIVTGSPSISNSKTEFEAAKTGFIQTNADYVFSWSSDLFDEHSYSEINTIWDNLGKFLHDNKGKLAIAKVLIQGNFGYTDDDTGYSAPVLICITPTFSYPQSETYAIQLPCGNAPSKHADGYGIGFVNLALDYQPSNNFVSQCGIDTNLTNGTNIMSIGYQMSGSDAYIKENFYDLTDPTDVATVNSLYPQYITIGFKLL